jgi:hypothetical protein
MREGEREALMSTYEGLKASYVACLESEAVTRTKFRSDKIKSILLTCFGGMSDKEDVYQMMRGLEDQHRGAMELQDESAIKQVSKRIVYSKEDFKKKAEGVTTYQKRGSVKPAKSKVINQKAIFKGNFEEATKPDKDEAVGELVVDLVKEEKKNILKEFANSKAEEVIKTYKNKGAIVSVVKGMIDQDIDPTGKTIEEIVEDGQTLVLLYLEENA